MKAISLKQPWASLVAIGKKTIETRTWSTNYRGDLLIVSSKTMDKNFPLKNFSEVFFEIPFGETLAIVNLVDCRPMRKEDEDLACCKIYAGAYAWIFSKVIKIDPFTIRGNLGLWNTDYKLPQEV